MPWLGLLEKSLASFSMELFSAPVTVLWCFLKKLFCYLCIGFKFCHWQLPWAFFHGRRGQKYFTQTKRWILVWSSKTILIFCLTFNINIAALLLESSRDSSATAPYNFIGRLEIMHYKWTWFCWHLRTCKTDNCYLWNDKSTEGSHYHQDIKTKQIMQTWFTFILEDLWGKKSVI